MAPSRLIGEHRLTHHAARAMKPGQRHITAYLLFAFVLLYTLNDSQSALAQSKETPSPVRLPLVVIDDNAYAISVIIDRTYEILLLIDTGATETIFNSNALKSRGIGVTRTRKRRQGIFKSGRVGLAQFTDLSIGGISIGEYTTTTANYKIDYAYWERHGLPATEGLLGFDILKKLNAVIDYRNDTLTLQPPASNR